MCAPLLNVAKSLEKTGHHFCQKADLKTGAPENVK